MVMTDSTTRTPTRTAPSFMAAVRDELHALRENRAARKQLRRELASYTHESEIADLEATLDRYDEAQVAEIRHILHSQRVA
jgi:hypothetical protein